MTIETMPLFCVSLNVKMYFLFVLQNILMIENYQVKLNFNIVNRERVSISNMLREKNVLITT